MIKPIKVGRKGHGIVAGIQDTPLAVKTYIFSNHSHWTGRLRNIGHIPFHCFACRHLLPKGLKHLPLFRRWRNWGRAAKWDMFVEHHWSSGVNLIGHLLCDQMYVSAFISARWRNSFRWRTMERTVRVTESKWPFKSRRTVIVKRRCVWRVSNNWQG